MNCWNFSVKFIFKEIKGKNFLCTPHANFSPLSTIKFYMQPWSLYLDTSQQNDIAVGSTTNCNYTKNLTCVLCKQAAKAAGLYDLPIENSSSTDHRVALWHHVQWVYNKHQPIPLLHTNEATSIFIISGWDELLITSARFVHHVELVGQKWKYQCV